jgi:hypothetical protein
LRVLFEYVPGCVSRYRLRRVRKGA